MNVILNTHVKCDTCPIRHRAVCSSCDEGEMKHLEPLKTYRSFQAGDQILAREDELTYVASVVMGVAALSKSLEDGRTQTVGLLFASDFIGRPERKQINYDVYAATDITLCCFDRVRFEQLLVRIPHLSQRLTAMALDELDAARDWMMLLGRKTALEKTASFLDILVRRTSGSAVEIADHINLPLSREEIANYLGLSLETVSRQLSALKRSGIIAARSRRDISILDYARLKAATGDDEF